MAHKYLVRISISYPIFVLVQLIGQPVKLPSKVPSFGRARSPFPLVVLRGKLCFIFDPEVYFSLGSSQVSPLPSGYPHRNTVDVSAILNSRPIMSVCLDTILLRT